MKERNRLARFMDGLLAFIAILAAVILLYGGALFIWQDGRDVPHYHVFKGIPTEKVGLDQFFNAMEKRDSFGIMEGGLYLLMSAPILRVFFLVIYYMIKRELLYLGFSLFALIVLIYSLAVT